MEEEEEATAAATSPKDQVAVAMPSSPHRGSSPSWTVGARLESKARDTNGGEQWFPAKVLEVEAEGRGVLVHYMQWNARHDEWIPSNSSRLRPVTTHGSGKSSRHNSGGGSDVEAAIQAVSATPMPAHKDFRPGEKVMATWKLNRKYLATVIRFEPTDGTYLVEFYDGVQCNVKPNNMRRPRKGENDVDQQESLRVNGAADNGSAENSDTEEAASTPSATSGSASSGSRRERKRKFDVKQLLNIRSVKSLRSNSKEDPEFEPSPSSTPTSTKAKQEPQPRRPRHRPERSQKEVEESPSSTPVTNGNKSRSKSLEDGPALAAVSGKRERRKKKFWDDEVDSSQAVSSSSSVTSSADKAKDAVSSSSSVSSSALKRKSSSSANPLPKKAAKRSSLEAPKESQPQAQQVQSPAAKSNGEASVTSEIASEAPQRPKDKPTGKENGKVLPYLQLDLSAEPELIAEKMVEGFNIPGMGQPIPVDSSSLPEGWEKRVIQRRIGITKGKWDVFITNPQTGKSFRSKTELQKHLDERKLPYTSDAFDFSLDDNLKRLRQIWKQYKVKPFLNNPKGTGNSGNFKHVPAKITQVQDTDVVHRNNSNAMSSGSHGGIASAMLSNANSSGTPSGSSSSNVASKSMPTSPPNSQVMSEADSIALACLAEISVQSETGQGLRCSIAKCGKLFRNDRLLRMHVKHYHPKVYEGLLFKHPQLAEADISEPTSPEAGRRLSDSSDFYHDHDQQHRRRMPSSSAMFDDNSSEFDMMRKKNHARLQKKLDEEAPLSSIYDDYEDSSNSNVFKRTRNDSVLSSVNSDTEELSVTMGSHDSHIIQQTGSMGQRMHSCPPTPPTFRLSKRRQAQMRKRVQQPIVRVSKIEDTPMGRDFRDEILSLSNSSALMSKSSTTTSPTGLIPNAAATMADHMGSSSYPPSEMDASIAGSEHLTNEELVNCTCRRVEEDGLMIQCDICLCWQHGYCVGLEDEDPVPEKHVCETCRQPPGGRSEAKFSIDQDWLKEGKLPSSESVACLKGLGRRKSPLSDQRETAFRKLSELMADLASLDKVLHGLRVKLHVASQPSNSKVFMWSSLWSVPSHQPMEPEELAAAASAHVENGLQPDTCTTDVNSTVLDPHAVAEKLSLLAAKVDSPPLNPQVNSGSSSSPSDLQEGNTNPLPKVNGIEVKNKDDNNLEASHSESPSQANDEKDPEKTEENEEQPLTNGVKCLMNADKAEIVPPSAEESTAERQINGNEVANFDDANFIPSVSEVERLLPSIIQEMEGSKPASPAHNPNSSMILPEPKRLDRDECRLNLLQHIESVQSEIEARYNAIEAAVAKIEAMDNAQAMPSFSDSDAKLKAKLNRLIQDLAVARHLVWTL